MTHDIKNLLQSLNVLCSVAGARTAIRRELQALMRRQLPVITQRLRRRWTSCSGRGAASESYVPARAGGKRSRASTRAQGVEFAAAGRSRHARLPRRCSTASPTTCCRTRSPSAPRERGVRVQRPLECGDGVELRVCDSGAPCRRTSRAACCARRCARARAWASACTRRRARPKRAAIALTLEENRDGEVCFALRGRGLS